MEAEFKCLGVDPLFSTMGNTYRDQQGFLVSDVFGGPVNAEKLSKFEPRDDDVFVVSFPKTGTTWLQEIVYLVGTNLDFESAKNEHLFERCPYLDYTETSMEMVSNMKSPRFLKLHIPYSSIPKSIIEKKCKLLYPMRNPKDTLVSYYHFCITYKHFSYTGDFATFFDMFLEGKVQYGPYWKHCLEFWNVRQQDNIFITTFEDMKKDLASVVRKVCEFMGKSYTDEQILAIVQHCTFHEMKTNTSTNPSLLHNAAELFHCDDKDKKLSNFMRKGEVGDWKNYFTEKMNDRFDQHIQKYFTPNGINFVYEM